MIKFINIDRSFSVKCHCIFKVFDLNTEYDKTGSAVGKMLEERKGMNVMMGEDSSKRMGHVSKVGKVGKYRAIASARLASAQQMRGIGV